MQILAYASVLTVEEFIRRVVARTDGFESVSPSPNEYFDRMFTAKADAVQASDLLRIMNGSEYYEVIEGLKEYISAYCVEVDTLIVRKEFILMLKDFYASASLDYEKVVTSLFK